MKFFLVFFLALFQLLNVQAQSKKEKFYEEIVKELPIKGDKVFYEKVFQVDSSLTKDIIFDRLREWNISALSDYKRAVKIDDKTTGVLVSQLSSPVYKRVAVIAFSGYMTFTVSVAAKDGKYNFQISDFIVIQKRGTSEDKYFAEEILNPDASKKMNKSTIAAFGDIPGICKLVSESIFAKVSTSKSVTEF